MAKVKTTGQAQYTNQQALTLIRTKLKEFGFEKKKLGDQWELWTLGDNFFDKTNRYARFEMRGYPKKIMVSALTATATKNSSVVSQIDWSKTVKVPLSDFAKEALPLFSTMIKSMKNQLNY